VREASSGWTSFASDCDDRASSTYPGAPEVCRNAVDEDCDGSSSEGCAATHFSCGAYGALDVGGSYGCTGPGLVHVQSVYFQVGCNDGETGDYTFTFSDGSSTSFSAACGTTQPISPRWVSSISMYMHAGGGPDSHISHDDWGLSYR
jgi:hypothetical protein